MSDTPRTDKRIKSTVHLGRDGMDLYTDALGFARQLERELNEAKKAIKEAYELIWANLDEDSANASEILSKAMEAEQS